MKVCSKVYRAGTGISRYGGRLIKKLERLVLKDRF